MVRSALVGAAIVMGVAIRAAPIASAETPSIGAPLSSCGSYTNVNGDCVESPDHNPNSLHDGDGTNSHSKHDQGSGSWHGGTGKSKK
jgi:hypothetical protein